MLRTNQLYNPPPINSVLLVVLYKRTPLLSTTIKSFIRDCKAYHSQVSLVIWDNSPYYQESVLENEIPSAINYIYRKGENTALSKIYNIISKSFPDSLIHIFDQDSKLSDEYFAKVYNASRGNDDINLIIPIIKHNNHIESPAIRQLHRGKFYASINPGVHGSKNLLCIASGMTVRTNCINDLVPFDETLTFYGIDSKFCFDYSKKFEYYYLIDYILPHSLSKYETEDFRTKLWRLNNQNRASLYISRRISLICYLICCIGCIRQYVKLFVKSI